MSDSDPTFGSPAALASLAHDVPIYADLDRATIARMAAMLAQKPLPTTPYFYSSATMLLFVILWLMGLGISAALSRVFGRRYTSLNLDQRRTTDVYVLNIILTTTAAGLQMAALSAFSLKFRAWHFNVLRAAAMLVSANYVYEFIYRPRMRWPMIAHHILTLFLVMLTLSTLYKVKDPTLMLSGNMLLFLATLEQPTFLALFFYRLRFPKHMVRSWLRFSSVQTIAVKSLAALGAMVVWVKWQVHDNDRAGAAMAYDALLMVSIVMLYCTQWYGAIVTWRIGQTLEARYRHAPLASAEEGKEEEEATKTAALEPAWRPSMQQQQQRRSLADAPHSSDIELCATTTSNTEPADRTAASSLRPSVSIVSSITPNMSAVEILEDSGKRLSPRTSSASTSFEIIADAKVAGSRAMSKGSEPGS